MILYDLCLRPDPVPDPDPDTDPNKFSAKLFLMKICAKSICMDQKVNQQRCQSINGFYTHQKS
jgi:hypothetical protein